MQKKEAEGTQVNAGKSKMVGFKRRENEVADFAITLRIDRNSELRCRVRVDSGLVFVTGWLVGEKKGIGRGHPLLGEGRGPQRERGVKCMDR